MAEPTTRDQAVEALGVAAHMGDPRNPSNGAGQYAIAAALLYVGDELRALRADVTNTLADIFASMEASR